MVSSAVSGRGAEQLDEAIADLNFEITFHRSLVPERPGRRYARETRRPGGRYKTRNRGQPSRLTPLSVIKFWLLPVPTQLNAIGPYMHLFLYSAAVPTPRYLVEVLACAWPPAVWCQYSGVSVICSSRSRRGSRCNC